MARNFEPAPFLLEQAVRTNQKSAALDALDLLAVHDLVLDDAKHMAHFFLGIGDQLKRQLQLGLEIVVRLHVVARNAKDRGTGFHEVLVLVAELHGLGRAARGVVLRVEEHHHRVADVG